MGWARLDDGFHDHPKVDGLSLAAVGLYTLSLTWAHRHRRKAVVAGHVPDSRVARVGGPKAKALAAELVTAGLWESEPNLGGYLIHDFADYLPKERDPEERREAGRRGAESKWQAARQGDGKPDGKLPSDSLASDGSRASAPAFPTRLSTSEGYEEGDRLVPLRAADASSTPKCSKHPNGDAPGPCAGCARVREHEERLEAAAAELRRRAIEGCPDCSGTSWIVDPADGTSRKCGHRRTA